MRDRTWRSFRTSSEPVHWVRVHVLSNTRALLGCDYRLQNHRNYKNYTSRTPDSACPFAMWHCAHYINISSLDCAVVSDKKTPIPHHNNITFNKSLVDYWPASTTTAVLAFRSEFLITAVVNTFKVSHHKLSVYNGKSVGIDKKKTVIDNSLSVILWNFSTRPKDLRESSRTYYIVGRQRNNVAWEDNNSAGQIATNDDDGKNK